MDIEHPEEWRDVKGFEGIYQVSNKSRVKSVDRFVICEGDNTRLEYQKFFKGKILKQIIGPTGYKVVHLRRGKVSKMVKVHRLVAIAFIENPNNYPDVNHINSIKTDNTSSNLEWCTPSQNSRHSYNVDKNFRNYTGKPRGINFHPRTKTWMAKMMFNTEMIFLGYHKEKSSAYKAYYEKFKELRGFAPWNIDEHRTH